MLKSRMKRREIESARAVAQLAAIETSIVTLGDEDLLDLVDIFMREAESPLKAMASAEMTKRGLSL